MDKEIMTLSQSLEEAWNNFVHSIPSIIIAVVVFMIGLLIIRTASKFVSKFLEGKSKDSLVTDFLVNIVTFIMIVLLAVLCLGILGYGSITDKILAGAGITTFVVGFALKDIGENFLAGIIMAFRRPFRVGDLIEIQKLKGHVLRMTLRETQIKTFDGRDVYIPNSIILKNPLENLTINFLLRTEFTINVVLDDLENTRLKVLEVVQSFPEVELLPAPSVMVQKIENDNVTLNALFWFKTSEVNAPGGGLRSKVLIKTIEAIKDKIYGRSEVVLDESLITKINNVVMEKVDMKRNFEEEKSTKR